MASATRSARLRSETPGRDAVSGPDAPPGSAACSRPAPPSCRWRRPGRRRGGPHRSPRGWPGIRYGSSNGAARRARRRPSTRCRRRGSARERGAAIAHPLHHRPVEDEAGRRRLERRRRLAQPRPRRRQRQRLRHVGVTGSGARAGDRRPTRPRAVPANAISTSRGCPGRARRWRRGGRAAADHGLRRGGSGRCSVGVRWSPSPKRRRRSAACRGAVSDRRPASRTSMVVPVRRRAGQARRQRRGVVGDDDVAGTASRLGRSRAVPMVQAQSAVDDQQACGPVRGAAPRSSRPRQARARPFAGAADCAGRAASISRRARRRPAGPLQRRTSASGTAAA